jgi:hypothetical protein
MFRQLIAKLAARKTAPAPATVAEILAPYGLDPAADRGFLCKVGKAATALYTARYGVKPAQVPAAAPNGRAITVAGYPAADHWMVIEAYGTVGLAEFEMLAA